MWTVGAQLRVPRGTQAPGVKVAFPCVRGGERQSRRVCVCYAADTPWSPEGCAPVGASLPCLLSTERTLVFLTRIRPTYCRGTVKNRVVTYVLVLALVSGAGTAVGEGTGMGSRAYSEAIIGPPVSEDAEFYPHQQPASWTTAEHERAALIFSEREGAVLSVAWKGATDPARVEAVGRKFHCTDHRKWSGWLLGTKKLTVRRGHKGQVRLGWEVSIEEPGFGAALCFAGVQYTSEGTEAGRIEGHHQIFPTAPGRWRVVGKTWKPGDGVTAIAPAIRFAGNEVKCVVRRVWLEPAAEKPAWVPSARHRARTPQVRYAPDAAEPQPDAAHLDGEGIDKLLAESGKAVPEIRQVGKFQVELRVNGERLAPVIHLASVAGLSSSHFRAMEDAGLRIAAPHIKCGPKSDTPGAPGNIWLGVGRYDFEPVRKAIRHTIARAPKSFVMLHLIVNVPNEWGETYPDDLHANARGEPGICGWSRVTRYGGPKPWANEFWEASNHSVQFRKDGAEMLRRLAQWLESVPEGKRVIGAYINGSADGQWLFSNELEFACYSKGALAAFRDYLRDKYATDAALARAWGTDVTFETAAIPAFEGVRTASQAFSYGGMDGNSGLLHYNDRRAQATDYNFFLSISNTERQIAFCKAFKKGSGGRLLAGGWWPTLPAPYPLSHGALRRTLASESIDFISRGGQLGAAFHGKLTVDELDLRSLKSGIEGWNDYDHPFIAKSQAEYARQLVAANYRAFAAGGGYHLFDMWGGWFWHPETMQMVKDSLRHYRHVSDRGPALGEEYVAVFLDEEAANHLTRLGQLYNEAAVGNTCETMSWGLSNCWGRTGVRVKFFLMRDALNPRLVLPRVAIFLNPLTMDKDLADRIRERYHSSGRVIAYYLAPGLAARKGLDSEVTGGAIVLKHGGTCRIGGIAAAFTRLPFDGAAAHASAVNCSYCFQSLEPGDPTHGCTAGHLLCRDCADSGCQYCEEDDA